jgi:small subunit ribosomal protein S20
MANHKSALKRIRRNNSKQLLNKRLHKQARMLLKELRSSTDYDKAVLLYPKVVSSLDKLAKNNIIHKRKASNLKSKVTKHINDLKPAA